MAPDGDGGVKPYTALLGTEGRIEPDTETPSDAQEAAVVGPGNPDDDLVIGHANPLDQRVVGIFAAPGRDPPEAFQAKRGEARRGGRRAAR